MLPDQKTGVFPGLKRLPLDSLPPPDPYDTMIAEEPGPPHIWWTEIIRMCHSRRLLMLNVATLAMLTALVGLPAVASAQVVQLPEFHFTTAATTVLVPDQGEVLLGGINRASDGSNAFGVPILGKIPVAGRPFGNVGIGQSRSATTLSVKAQIHDFEAMDQALLSEAAARRGGAPIDNVTGRTQYPRRADGAAGVSVADAERRHEAELSAAAATKRLEVAAMLEKAQAAEADGRAGVARIYYRIVARDARDPATKALVQERLLALSGRSSASKVAVTEAPATR
ncbi:MAG: type II and III secretion system protein [Planctomycetia bacterium]|nr:type II and III secretion system protein [Planctomycetia bacterium]